jgi:hypothetical protein
MSLWIFHPSCKMQIMLEDASFIRHEFTILTSSLVISFLRSAGVAAAVVAARSSSTAWRSWFWRWASCGLEAQSRAASTMRAVASARVFAAARSRRCISESGCFSASPCTRGTVPNQFIWSVYEGVSPCYLVLISLRVTIINTFITIIFLISLIQTACRLSSLLACCCM